MCIGCGVAFFFCIYLHLFAFICIAFFAISICISPPPLAWGKLACARGGSQGFGKWTPVTGRSKEASLKALIMTHHVCHEDFFAEKLSL